VNSGKVKIEHLLTHTSGFGDYFPIVYDQTYQKSFESTKDFQEIIFNSDLCFEPGTSWSYSNTGFLILGLLIETITQMEYCDYIAKYIFNIAEMGNSGFFYINEPVNNRTICYYKYNEKWN